MSLSYTENFFNRITKKSYISWKKIFQILFQYFSPQSLLDVWWGYGPWSKAFYDLTKSHKYTVLDWGYVDLDKIIVDKKNFISLDLSQPFNFNKKYDLAICMEVAEHLAKESSDSLVKSLTAHSDIILFSAAIPWQWWTNHFNEQCPSYWSDKFARNGFVCLDFLRILIWDDSEIDWWYRQNILLFIKKNVYIDKKFNRLSAFTPVIPSTLIHPMLWAKVTKLRKLTLIFGAATKKLFRIS